MFIYQIISQPTSAVGKNFNTACKEQSVKVSGYWKFILSQAETSGWRKLFSLLLTYFFLGLVGVFSENCSPDEQIVCSTQFLQLMLVARAAAVPFP